MSFIHKLKLISESKELQAIEYMKCKKDPWYMMKTWVFTLDSHDKVVPIKKFPELQYLEALTIVWFGPEVYPDYKQRLLKLDYKEEQIDEIFNNWVPLILIPKSRQMRISWWCCAVHLHLAMFIPGSNIFYQSKKESDADNLIKRTKFIYDHLPFFLRREEVNPSNKGKDLFCKVEFPSINSSITGIPQGGDQIRMHTASAIFADEMAFQSEAEDAYGAAKPTIDGGGRFTGVSTANPGFFHLMVDDKL